MELPNELRLGLERELRTYDARTLGRAAAELSSGYRGEGKARGPLDGPAAAAYAAARMPATYAAAAAALRALATGLPGFAPRSLLDVGAGTGAALWAAAYTWESLESATLIERDGAMAALGGRLAAAGRRTPVARATWRVADLAGPWEAPPHDLVTAAYVLGELPEGARAGAVERLWRQAAGAMLLIEPGTPRGWATIRAAREQLRAAGASIAAPCPHQGACPMPDDDWCHFAQRLGRSKTHRAAKGAELGYEDEKYSYIAVARAAPVPVAARVLRHPVVRPGRVELALCADAGLRRAVITRAAATAWRHARDLRWGDALPPGILDQEEL
jgi:ribosomal protein RSM22 (predicted rRNA methylase)